LKWLFRLKPYAYKASSALQSRGAREKIAEGMLKEVAKIERL
jgi:hypothetical protein